ncbi:MAG TPA: DUF6504 family protein [Candidatus Nanopelagicales bacterium]|jgi:hypothetical protein
MTRTYADPIDVRSIDDPHDQLLGQPGEPRPAQFLWRGRLYLVREVIAHWIESSAWWGGSRRSLEGAIPAHEHEVWRVAAQAGRSGSPGVYDLCRDVAADRWVLARAMD